MLVKSLERLYRTLPQFADMAKQQEFIESLAATLFPLRPSGERGVGMVCSEEVEGESRTHEFDDDGVSTL